MRPQFRLTKSLLLYLLSIIIITHPQLHYFCFFFSSSFHSSCDFSLLRSVFSFSRVICSYSVFCYLLMSVLCTYTTYLEALHFTRWFCFAERGARTALPVEIATQVVHLFHFSPETWARGPLSPRCFTGCVALLLRDVDFFL